jgi:hypothetical protein
MILTDVIKAAAEERGYKFINARRDLANMNIDEQQGLKVAVLYEWTEELEFKKGGKQLSVFRCLMFIVEKVGDLQTDPTIVETVVQRQRVGAKKILDNIREDEAVVDILSGNLNEIQNVFDSYYTGVDCEFRVQLREDDTIC